MNEKGDLISRQAVEDITWEEPSYSDPLNVLTEVREKVRALPSVENKCFDGMTNGEVIQAVFGVMVLTIKDGKVWVERIFFPFDEVWWDAPYKAESEDKE